MTRILSVILTFLSISIHAQDYIPLFQNRKVEVKYAMFSHDGKSLVVANANDSLLILDYPSLKTLRLTSVFTSGSPMTDTYAGRKIFHVTASGDLIHVRKAIEGKDAVIYLRSEKLASGEKNFEVKIKTIPTSELAQEKLYNRLTYGLTVSGNTVLFVLNETILAIDAQSGQTIKQVNVPFAFYAALSPKQDRLAYLSSDSLIMLEWPSQKRLFSRKVEGMCLHFQGDTIVVGGKQTVLLNSTTSQKLKEVYHHPGFIYGIESRADQKEFTLSNSYFTEKGFSSSYTSDGEVASVYHLPKTDGFIAFYHPVSRQRYVLTTRGLLYEFQFNTEPKPVSQTGHRSTIVSYHLAKDGRRLVTAASGGEILIWDVPTGRVMERYSTNQTGIEMAFFDESETDLIFLSYGDYKKIHRSIPSNAEQGAANNVFTDPSDERFMLSKANADEEQNRKATLLAEKYKLGVSGPVALSGKYVAGFNTNGKLRVADIGTGQLSDLTLNEVYPSFVKALSFYTDNILLVEGERNTILLFDVSRGKVARRLGKVREQGRKGVNKILFSAAGDTMLTVINNQDIQLWNLKKAEKIMQITPAKTAIQDHGADYRNGRISFISENNNLYVGTVAELASGKLKMIAYLDTSFYQKADQYEVAAQKGKGYPMRLSLSPDAKELCILRFNNPTSGAREVFVDFWDLGTMKLRSTSSIPDVGYPCWTVSWEHKMVAVWDFPAMSKKEYASLAKMNQQMGIAAPAKSFPGIKYIDFQTTPKVQDLFLDRIGVARLGEGSIPILTRTDIWIKDYYSMMLHRVDINKQSIKQTVDVSGHYQHDRVGEDYVLNNQRLIYAVHPWTDGHSTSIRSWSEAKKQVQAQSNTSGIPITHISQISAQNTFAVGLNDNTVSIRDAATLKESFRIMQDEGGYYAFITPEQYYKADRTAASALQFSWNNRSYSLKQFDSWFNRPDKIIEATGFSRPEDVALLNKAYLKRKKNQLHVPSAQDLPIATILNIHNVPLETELDSVRIELEAKSGRGIVQSKVLVNGVPVRTFDVKAAPVLRQSLWVRLLPGKNKIGVVALDQQGVTSMQDEIEIEFTGKAEKPDLYFFAVAINDYKNPDLKLNYAVKDARDMARFFSKDPQYNKVFIDSIFNSSVTRENVMGIARKLSKARPKDVVILFFAGHGVLDENFDFRYACWNIETSNPSSTAILYDDIEKLLSNIAPRKKLLLIDACHSGEVDKEGIVETAEEMMRKRNATQRTITTQTFGKVHHNVFSLGLVDRSGFEMMQELFFAPASDNGAHVVVAAAGDSYAIESEEWKNGLFTYCLLKGLSSRAADYNGDRQITIEEMVNFLKQEVKTLSEGQQVPRFRQENQDNYFVIWR